MLILCGDWRLQGWFAQQDLHYQMDQHLFSRKKATKNFRCRKKKAQKNQNPRRETSISALLHFTCRAHILGMTGTAATQTFHVVRPMLSWPMLTSFYQSLVPKKNSTFAEQLSWWSGKSQAWPKHHRSSTFPTGKQQVPMAGWRNSAGRSGQCQPAPRKQTCPGAKPKLLSNSILKPSKKPDLALK